MVTDKQIKNKMQKLDKDNWIVRTNTLNEMRDNNMTLTELRLFAIYQSKINPYDSSSRVVEFELSEFERIMEIKRANVSILEQIGRRIVTRTATIRDDNGGFSIMPLFGEFKLYKKSDEKWYVKIDSHDRVLPYMFEFQKRFFKYQLWNALRLKSVNQQRMYEVLKQYEIAKATEIELEFLKALLGIKQSEYKEYRDFKKRVLDPCQQALSENTDIKFTYEPIKRGKGGKVVAIKFNIEKNTDYVDQLTLSEFIDFQVLTIREDEPQEIYLTQENYEQEQMSELHFENENLEFLSDSCNREFNEEQMSIIKSYLVKLVPFDSKTHETDQYDYLLRKYQELNYYNKKKMEKGEKIADRFKYLLGILKNELSNKGAE